jgi:hypothetical protein
MLPKTGLAVLAALALLIVGASSVHAQSSPPKTSACLTESSFEFPLWNDGIGWKQFNAYSSIQLADVDGDGQAELIGNGPQGVEIWHWEPHGQAWVQMNVGAPTLAATDTLMTADVDGDGQAEIIQISPNLGSSPVVNVWHYDGNLNAQAPTGPGVWRLEPQLRLTLTPSVGSNSTAIAPTIRFASFANPSGKQQQLVSMTIRVTPGLVYYTPFVYQVNSTQTGWTTLTSGPMTNGGGTFANSVPASLQVGDVSGDGRPDIVLLESVGKFLIFPQTGFSPGAISFSSGVQAGPDSGGIFSSGTFALGDALGLGYQQIYTVEQYNGSPSSQDLKGYQFSPSTVSPSVGLIQVGLLPSVPSANAAGLQVAYTGLNPANPTGASILILNSDGLDEYAGGFLRTKISSTPFVSQTRFGDDPSHYKTIQMGTVFAYNTAGQAYKETILVGRDANGIHTLVPTSAGNICGSAKQGFDLPQKNMTGTYLYFPPFVSSCTAQETAPLTSQAYAYFNTRYGGGKEIRAQYTNINIQPPDVSGASYGSISPAPAFTQCDFTTVQNQLEQEITVVNNARAYFGTTEENGLISGNLQSINMGESNALSTAISDLSAPPDPGSTAFAATVATQAISSIFDFIGNTGIPVASQLSEVFSVIGDVISDVQGVESSTGSTLQTQGLTLQTQLTATFNDQQQANANTLYKVLQNWDLLSQLNQLLSASSATPPGNDDANARAVNAYAIAAWQQLMPSAWNIVAIPCNTGEGVLPAGYQPYFVDGQDNNLADLPYCQNYGTLSIDFVVYAKLQSTHAANFFGIAPAPVALGPIQDLLALGVNWYDVLGRRNGWQQVPFDLSAYPLSVTPTIPLQNPYFNPPAVAVPPAAGAPSALTLFNGEPSGQSQQQCGSNSTEPDIYQQSTPINSIFPVPIGISVVDASGTGVPNATVQVSGIGLSPNTSTVVTDSSGSANFYLLANNIVQVPYTATFTVTSAAPSCGLTQKYILQNTAAVSGTTPTNPDIQAVVSVTSKVALFTTDRLWYVTISDPTGTATGGTYNVQLTHTRGPASCNPVPVPINGGFTAAGGGNFKTSLGWNFSSCTGLNLFTLTVTGNFTIPMDDGSTYQATYSASTSNQTP